jgi:2-oxo-4-hydroxy-4-carboxy-5-ureidoimidazoline decarboxylase
VTLEEINRSTPEQFVEAVGWVFEHSLWVAERTWPRRPFPTLHDLHAAMVAEVDRAGAGEQLALLRAHPDLGTRASMTRASTREQAGAGLDSLTPEEFDSLATMNAAYRDKFGFPFLFAVKGSTKHDVLVALEKRLGSSVDDERREALRQAARIALFRLEATVKESQ